MPKMLFQLYIDVEQFNHIEQKAKETGRSRASIVREYIEWAREKEKKSDGN